jgi:hypothetical protein
MRERVTAPPLGLPATRLQREILDLRYAECLLSFAGTTRGGRPTAAPNFERHFDHLLGTGGRSVGAAPNLVKATATPLGNSPVSICPWTGGEEWAAWSLHFTAWVLLGSSC